MTAVCGRRGSRAVREPPGVGSVVGRRRFGGGEEGGNREDRRRKQQESFHGFSSLGSGPGCSWVSGQRQGRSDPRGPPVGGCDAAAPLPEFLATVVRVDRDLD